MKNLLLQRLQRGYKLIKENENKKYDSFSPSYNFIEEIKSSFSWIIAIVTNHKILFDYYSMKILADNNSKYYKLSDNISDNIIIKLIEIIVNNFENLESLEKLVSDIVNLLASLKEKLKWINNLNYELNQEDKTVNDNEGNIYKLNMIKLNEINQGESNTLGILLMRFGVDIKNNGNYTIGYNESKKTLILFIIDIKQIITIKLNDSYIVDTENCYLIDKISKKKLIFNIMEKNLPFANIIPHNSPYLCYTIDNQYYLEFINSDSFIKNIKF